MRIEISELLRHQFEDDNFARVDIFLKVCALTRGSAGIKAYEDMYCGLFPGRKKKVIKERLNKLNELSNLYKLGKFDLVKSPIILTRNWKMWDGAHRLSVAIANEEKMVNIHKDGRIYFREKPSHTVVRYSKFLSKDSLLELKKCMDEILTRYEVKI